MSRSAKERQCRNRSWPGLGFNTPRSDLATVFDLLRIACPTRQPLSTHLLLW